MHPHREDWIRPRDAGAKMLVEADGESFGTIGGGEMERELVEQAIQALNEGRARTLVFALGVAPKEDAIQVDSKCGGEVKVFLDVIKPNPKLILIGSGHVAKPLAEFADKAGFEVIVLDDAETATKERFPMAKALYTGCFEEELNRVEVRPFDFVAVVHGDPSHETTALTSMLRRRPAYIGLLGSRNKAAEHKRRLIDNGFNKEDVEAIHSPIGLDIGAETPEEIAVSILAELIKARRRG